MRSVILLLLMIQCARAAPAESVYSIYAPECLVVVTQDDYESVGYGESYWFKNQLHTKSAWATPPEPLVSEDVPEATTTGSGQSWVGGLGIVFLGAAMVLGGARCLIYGLKPKRKPQSRRAEPPPRRGPPPPKQESPPPKPEAPPPRADNGVQVVSMHQAYEILGVPYGKLSMVKAAYRERMRQYHPDRVAHLGKALRDLAAIEALKTNLAMQFISANSRR
jgi:hypothetical protein